MHLLGKIPFSLRFSEDFSKAIAGYLQWKAGKTIRAVVVDLDNTLWGGIIGEDGIEKIQLGEEYPGNAFVQFQKYLKLLQQKGIFLALCSKNTLEVALEGINSLESMVLNINDFSVIKINWENKSENLRKISEELNVGLKNIYR
jgi:FkbH-like protein